MRCSIQTQVLPENITTSYFHWKCVLEVPHVYIYSMETLVRTGPVVFVFSAVKAHLIAFAPNLVTHFW